MDGGSLHYRRAMVAIGRLLEHHHPPLSAPVEVRHSHRLNFYLGIVLVLFMAVSVVALVCCCYHLEWRLRLQARSAARRVSEVDGILGQNAGSLEMIEKVTKQEASLSVMMPGDSIPSFLAKVKPHGSVTGTDFADLPVLGAKDAAQTLRLSRQNEAWKSLLEQACSLQVKHRF